MPLVEISTDPDSLAEAELGDQEQLAGRVDDVHTG
jgi:hypothetical protein